MFIKIQDSDYRREFYVNADHIMLIEPSTYGDGSIAGYSITMCANREYYTQDIESVMKVL